MKLDASWSTELSSPTIAPLRCRNPEFRAHGFAYPAPVHRCMGSLTMYDFKIRKPIVIFAVVLMMNDFIARQVTAQMSLHHQPMLILILTSHWAWMAGCSQQDIPARINEPTTLPGRAFGSAARSARARTGTIARRLIGVGKSPKEFATSLTLKSLAWTASSSRHRPGDATHRTKPLWACEVLAKSSPTPLALGGWYAHR